MSESPDERKQNILAITPSGQDPVIFWHQVAQDAIQAAEKAKISAKVDESELRRLQRYERSEHERNEVALRKQTIPDFRDLLYRVQNGDFSMNVQLSFYPNTERKERDYNDE